MTSLLTTFLGIKTMALSDGRIFGLFIVKELRPVSLRYFIFSSFQNRDTNCVPKEQHPATCCVETEWYG